MKRHVQKNINNTFFIENNNNLHIFLIFRCNKKDIVFNERFKYFEESYRNILKSINNDNDIIKNIKIFIYVGY